MNKNVMIVLVGGFVVAILVAVLVQASLGGKKTEEQGPKTQVLVAAKDLAVGTELSPGDLKWQTWPGDQAFAGAIVREGEQKADEALTGKLIQRVAMGQPVLPTFIFKEGRGNLVAASLGKGMRAIAIPVKADTMAGGFVAPGDFVDVILSYQVATNSRDNPSVASLVSKQASETILQNIKVLAVDQEAARSEDKAKIARTVTLEVSVSDAERLALAANMGDLTLTLRGIGDEAKIEGASTTTDVQVGQIMQDVARLQGGGSGPGGSVRVYNGDAVEDVRTRSGGDILIAPRDSADSMEEETVLETGEEISIPDEDSAEGDVQ
jgi:pilus assembly protein CpaB